MSDYAKHIEVLDGYARIGSLDPYLVPALTAASELMRAAAKSHEERASRVGEAPADYAARMEAMDNTLRAAALAEGYARGKVDYLDAYLDKEQERKIESEASAREIADVERELQNKLSAAQAEIEQLRVEYDQDHRMLVGVAHALETKLTERDAEIERLRAENARTDANYRHACELRSSAQRQLEPSLLREGALQTKLTNLRAAAERAEQQLRVCGKWRGLVAVIGVADDVLNAIEASR